MYINDKSFFSCKGGINGTNVDFEANNQGFQSDQETIGYYYMEAMKAKYRTTWRCRHKQMRSNN
jgi:hypothetical protein